MNIYYLLFNLIITAKLIYADIESECEIVNTFLGKDTEGSTCCNEDGIHCAYADSDDHIIEM